MDNIKIGRASLVNGYATCIDNRLSGPLNYVSIGKENKFKDYPIRIGLIHNYKLDIQIMVCDENLNKLEECSNLEEVDTLFWSLFIANLSVETLQDLFDRVYEKGRKRGSEEVKYALRDLIGVE